PRASTPFAYSSTATATMLPRRFAGLSCAFAGAASAATAHAVKQTERKRNRIYDRIYRIYLRGTTLAVHRRALAGLLRLSVRRRLRTLEHHHRPGGHLTVRQCQPHSAHRISAAPCSTSDGRPPSTDTTSISRHPIPRAPGDPESALYAASLAAMRAARCTYGSCRPIA